MEETKIKDFLIQLKIEPKLIQESKLVEKIIENGMDFEAVECMKSSQIEPIFKRCAIPTDVQIKFENELEAWQKTNNIKPIMEKRIDLEKRGRPADQITDLNLDNCRSTSIVGLSDEYTALESLSLINVGLTTLKGFPNLPNLKKLELSDNRISNGLNHLTTSPKISYLNLSGNKIKDLETLKPLQSFQNLEILDLFNNEATTVESYREKIFAMLPSLKYLDGFDLNEVEASSDGDDDEEVNGNDTDDVSDEIGDDEDDVEYDEEEDDSESEEEDNGHVSLAEVYNDNLEEDNSDWGEENEAEDDEDEASDENEEGDEAANQKEAETPDDAQARGKKRKHDG